jgi:hypothetical protein
MAATYTEVKVAASVLDYRFDWSAWLGSDTIDTAAWAVTSATKDSENATTTTSTVRVSGGTAGTSATLKNTITTAAGLLEVRSIELQIVASIIAREVVKAPGATKAIPAPTWSDLGGDPISTYTWSAASGLTIGSGGSTATVVVSGGTAGVDYALTCAIETAGGQEDSRVILVQVRER